MNLQQRTKSAWRRTLLTTAAVATMGGAAMTVNADEIEVQVVDNRFVPEHVTITPGDTVRWVWAGVFGHSTTSASGLTESWDSGIQNTPFEFTHVFNDPGIFTYYCIPHGFDRGDGTVGGMSGSVFVYDGCLTLAMDQLVSGQTTTFTITGGTPGQKVVLVYGLDRSRTEVAGTFDFCATFGIAGVNQSRIVGTLKTLNPDAEIRQFIPRSAQGLDLVFQAAMQGTCPDICMSNIIEAAVQ